MNIEKVKIIHELAKKSSRQIVNIETHINLIKEFDKEHGMDIGNLSNLIEDLEKSRKVIEKIQMKMSEIKKERGD